MSLWEKTHFKKSNSHHNELIKSQKAPFPVIPVIAAGRISIPARAESMLKEKEANLNGLVRMLWGDPQ